MKKEKVAAAPTLHCHVRCLRQRLYLRRVSADQSPAYGSACEKASTRAKERERERGDRERERENGWEKKSDNGKGSSYSYVALPQAVS